jgi:hypothetical protein
MTQASQMKNDECRGKFAHPPGHLWRFIFPCFSRLLIFSVLFCVSLSAQTINLAGKWTLRMDPQDRGITSHYWTNPFDEVIQLPGTLSQARKGNPLELKPVLPAYPPKYFNPQKGLMFGRDESALTNSPLAHLYQRFSYIGPVWYRREINIPKNWTGKDVELVLERVIWESRVWVNGQFMGAQNSLTTPHRYEIGSALKPGHNEIVIRVDNRRQLAIGDPHAYTEQAQSIWNGIVGRIELQARDKTRIDQLQMRPDLARHGVEVTVATHNDGKEAVAAALSLRVVAENFHGRKFPELKLPISLLPGDGDQKLFYPMGTNFEPWSEFNPKLYRMQAALSGPAVCSETAATFGMREFKSDGRQFTINGLPVFLRGTVNCCEFPKTGYPDMTGEQWEKIFSTVKSFGLNHLRFHTWYPPEIAFELADRYGVYLEVELPNWCFHLGQDTNVTQFFRQEGERMIREYGNHPSWVMFTMGNELRGDYAVLDDLENHFRELDPQLLYDSTTYPNSPARGKVPGPVDDYYISQDTKNGRARGQDIFENTRPTTETNFACAISCIPVPFISHEVGQYCVYPALAEIPKYDGVLENTAFEAIRADLKSKGRLADAPVYTRDSGRLAALLYKEEIERALRTTNQNGFQLLQLNDFPGQGTSTVGLLDAFWDSKGLITPKEFRKFCGPVVPLLLMPKFIWQNDDVFNGRIEFANFGPAPITNATVLWKISGDGGKIAAGSFVAPLIPLGNGILCGNIRQSLSGITKPEKLKVTIAIQGTAIANDWPVWIYPKTEIPAPANDIAIFQTADHSFYEALRAGKRVLLLPSRDNVRLPLAAQFVPVFWNPVMFPNQPGSMGAMIDAKAPVFADFPTDPWTNWQWWELLHRSFAVNLDGISARVAMPLRWVDKFNRNALPAAIFEAQVGAGKLLVCTLDISDRLDTRIAARQLRRSILNYMGSARFQPSGRLNPKELNQLFRTAP